MTPEMYQISKINNSTLDWINSISNQNKPFIAFIGPHTPHFPSGKKFYIYSCVDIQNVFRVF